MENKGFQEFETQGDEMKLAAASATRPMQEEVEMMRKRLKKMEEEVRNNRAKLEKDHVIQVEEEGEEEEEIVELTQAEKEEIDSRSVYVGNVDYDCTAEEVQQHFESCGIVNRITILADAFGHPKGYAYVEFSEAEHVQKALGLNESELHGRQLKVSPKRTNVPGMSQHRGRRFWRGPFIPGPPFHPSYGYGRVPRYRRYSPY